MNINSEDWDTVLMTMHKMLPKNMDDALLVDLIHFVLVQYNVDWPRALRIMHIVCDLHATHTGEKVISDKSIH